MEEETATERARAQYRHRAERAVVRNPSSWTVVPSKALAGPDPVVVLTVATDVQARRAAALELLERGEGLDHVVRCAPMDAEMVEAILARDENLLPGILERLWDFRGVHRRNGWPYDEGPLAQLINRGGRARNAAELLATWGGNDLAEYLTAAGELGESPETLETYLTLIDDQRGAHGRHSVPGHVAKQAAALASTLHPAGE